MVVKVIHHVAISLMQLRKSPVLSLIKQDFIQNSI